MQQLSSQRQVVIDLGSNSFRLVVFEYEPDRWWQISDEVHANVRISEGMQESALQAKPMQRAFEALELFSCYCRRSNFDLTNVKAVATSAIREASNGKDFLREATQLSGFPITTISREQEAYYGYLAAVNSSNLTSGTVIDLGGGSLQLVSVEQRKLKDLTSLRLGAVVLSERFLDSQQSSAAQIERLKRHIFQQLESCPWSVPPQQQLIGIGGTVRNLAAAIHRRLGLPDLPIQGFQLDYQQLLSLTDLLAQTDRSMRGEIPGIKQARGDIILAGAVTIGCLMEWCGSDNLQVTRAGMREGVFFQQLLKDQTPPLFESVKESAVYNLLNRYRADLDQAQRVTHSALALLEELDRIGVAKNTAEARSLLWAAAMLHQLGITVDHHNHHKHSRYLILNAGMAGYSQQEIALIAQTVRYYRKGTPSAGLLSPYLGQDDLKLIDRFAAILKLVTQLEIGDRPPIKLKLSRAENHLMLNPPTDYPQPIVEWAVKRSSGLFQRAFDLPLALPVD